MRLGSQSLQSEEGVVFSPRSTHTYHCTNCGHDTDMVFSADAEARARAARAAETAATPWGAGRSGSAAGGGGAGAPAAPPAPRSPVQPPQTPGSEGNKGQSGKGNAGQGQGQSSGNPDSSGQGGQSSGQEGAKRATGVSALLLAVPTRDRLVGIAGPGPSRSTTRQAPPQRQDAGAVAAGDRGRQNGDAGLVPQRATTPYEDRLVQRYFARRPDGGAGR